MRIRVRINNDTVYDGDPGDWEFKPPPEFVQKYIGPNMPEAQPYMKAILIAMTDAVTRSESTDIQAFHRSNRWEVKVEKVMA